MVRSVPPVLLTVKLLVTVPFSGTEPKSMFIGEMVSTGAVPPLPDRDRFASPPSVLISRLSL
jgi:hypothetical protein